MIRTGNRTIKRFYHIETLGCQMNKLDSELVAGLFKAKGYAVTADPAEADVAILNTCSVREHAEQKALSRLGHFNSLRRGNGRPTVIAMMGCFAQRAADEILRKAPFIDIVCGPGQIHQLATLAEQAPEKGPKRTKGWSQVVTDDFRAIRGGKADVCDDLENLDLHRTVEAGAFQRFVRVQRGCDKFCAYCVVPHVRGPEQSRPVDHILEEVRRIDQSGCREITLIGQTINSYRFIDQGATVDLPELLYRVHRACSIPRIRFITSYPSDFSLRIFEAMAELPRICPYLHLPAQHGSDTILERMNRKYTVEEYLEILEQGRRIVPQLSLAGDFIVGFPTETEKDHAESVALLEKVRYKNCFVFKYSVRPGTLAEKRWTDDVPEEVKSHRHAEMLAVQDRIAHQDNQSLVGQTVRVLIEGPSKKSRLRPVPQLVGRTTEDKIVIFDGPKSLAGRIMEVKITSASSLTLFGERTCPEPAFSPVEQE